MDHGVALIAKAAHKCGALRTLILRRNAFAEAGALALSVLAGGERPARAELRRKAATASKSVSADNSMVANMGSGVEMVISTKPLELAHPSLTELDIAWGCGSLASSAALMEGFERCNRITVRLH